MYIAENLQNILNKIPKEVKLVAVSKTKPVSDILQAYEQNHKRFGENKVQELIKKFEDMPKDIEWHMIGHLQTNKVKHIAPFVYMIHGVDNLNLLQTINKEAVKTKQTIKCLLQMYIAKEETKFGYEYEDVCETIESKDFELMKNIEICGLMGMATFTENQNTIRNEFRSLKQIFDKLKDKYFRNQSQFCEISMGMSSDYQIAIQEGSTIVRIGSHIFGERNYV